MVQINRIPNAKATTKALAEIPSRQARPAPANLRYFRRAYDFARRAGWPKDMPFSLSNVSWQISPDDSTMSAEIRVDEGLVQVILTMSYMGRVIKMIQLTCDKDEERSEGLLFRNDVNQAFDCFKAHLESMMHGPVQMRQVA